MKFKRKHTKGPFRRSGFNVLTEFGVVIAKVVPWDSSGCREEDNANIDAICNFDKMIDYMVRRVEKLQAEVELIKEIDSYHELLTTDDCEKELSHIIEILKNAGVEVEV